MKFIIQPTGIDLTNAIEDYITDKFSSFERFFEGEEALDMRVEVGKPSAHHQKGQVFYAEANFKVPGKMFRAEDTDYDLFVAIDKVRKILERQVTEYKQKLVDTRKH